MQKLQIDHYAIGMLLPESRLCSNTVVAGYHLETLMVEANIHNLDDMTVT